jgi:hypothetical protein
MASKTNFECKLNEEFFIGKKTPGKNDLVEWNERKDKIPVTLNSMF